MTPLPRSAGRLSLAWLHALVLLVAGGFSAAAAETRPTPPLIQPLEARRIVFLGDSITYAGEYLEWVETYVRLHAPQSSTEFINLGLPSETVSGLSEPGHAGGSFPRPDLHERLGRVLEKTKPDLIFACYGMNDGIYYPFGEERFRKYQEGIQRLRDRAAAAGAQVIHLTPAVFDPVPLAGHTLPAGREEYRQPFEGYDGVLDRYAQWLAGQRAQGWEVVDIHGPIRHFLDEQRKRDAKFVLAGDGVHPNPVGHWLIAREVLRRLGAPEVLLSTSGPEALLKSHPQAAAVHALVQERHRLLRDAWLTETRHVRPGMAAGKPLPEATAQAAEIQAKLEKLLPPAFPGKRSVWNGFDRYDFEIGGRPVLVVVPKREIPGRPWVWHGEFFGHKPNPDIALLGRGFHVVYASIPDHLGAPSAVAHWNQVYAELTTQHHLGPKPALVGLSRGGLYCYNWAIANPSKVACIYADAPVCDFRSWPGGKGKGPGSARDWKLILERYGFADEAAAMAYTGNPVDNLGPLAQAKVPLLHVYGDADEVVPWDENTGVVAERYRKLGGEITLIAKPGVKHHPHGLDDSTPIVDFIVRSAAPGQGTSGPRDAEGRPLVRKLGTLDLDLVETTPVVFRGRLLRFEWVRDGYWNNTRKTNYFRFIDLETGKSSTPFADGHEFGSAFVENDTVCVTGTYGRDQVHLFVSRDLESWEQRSVITPGKYGIFNTSLCRTDSDYVLMFEIDRPREEAGVAFTARFARSKDLKTWEMTDPACNYARDRYTAPHCLRWLDGWFYDFYLEAKDGYEMRVVRSKDLANWTSSPLNPVLRASPDDKHLANTSLTSEQQQRIANAADLNNSDIDFCEWQGRLAITYSWGNQLGVEHLAGATYDGSLAQFLRGWFP